MVETGEYFYKNQDIVLKTPQKNYKGYISEIKDGYLFVIIYAFFLSEKQMVGFEEDDGTILNAESEIIKKSPELFLIYQDINQTNIFKQLLSDVTVNRDTISLKLKPGEMLSSREGREFLRVPALLQFVYEKITMEEFLEIKDAYISRPSFTTSVYGLYNIAAPKIFQSTFLEKYSHEEDSQPVNPKLENMLIAINSKLDIILSILNPDASIFAKVKEKKVSISGSGMMFELSEGDFEKWEEQSLEQGSIIKMTILFPLIPQFVIRAIAQVVKITGHAVSGAAKNDTAGHPEHLSIACKFIAINESDRDAIIKFTLEMQRKQIKKSQTE